MAQECHLTAKIISAVGGGAITFKQEMRRHFGHCFLPVQLLLPSYDFSHLGLEVRLSFFTQYNRLAHITHYITLDQNYSDKVIFQPSF